jgi:hypothetical protein
MPSVNRLVCGRQASRLSAASQAGRLTSVRRSEQHADDEYLFGLFEQAIARAIELPALAVRQTPDS